ncbi:MAG: lectin like domain-containing protein, partial [Methanobacteriaceae archaeon]|nr:lectin like domain-containing protein [Methanobacteriaceae archaeon]
MTYPESYDLRNLSYVTPVKNQVNGGNCWAFASYASLESYLLINENITYDFSENNLKNLMGSYSKNGTDFNPNNGGNEFMAAAYLSRWSGPVLESQDPYDATSVYSEEFNATYYVQDIAFLERRENALDNDKIKYVLLNYSPVAVSLYYSSSYYNYSSYSYYYNDSNKVANHMVTVVGWDDNYNASLFKVEAPGNGAFIVKNSFGTGFGDEGYFYISYYDSALAGYNDLAEGNIGGFAILNIEETDVYKTNYQYDILGYNLGWGYDSETGWFASKYNSSSNNPLTAVATYFFSENSEYSLYVYVNEELKLTQNGTIEIPGYRTIILNSPVLLNEGDEFKVVIKSTTPGYNYPIPIEAQIDNYSKATSNPNETFISEDGINWVDLYSAKTNASVCLKVFTGYATNLTMQILANTTGYIENEYIQYILNITNNYDTSKQVNISAILDSGANIISTYVSKGSYDVNTNIWSINEIGTNETVQLILNTQIINVGNVTNTFNLVSKLYNLNNITSINITLVNKNYSYIVLDDVGESYPSSII